LNLLRLLAVGALAAWPSIPIFFVQVHAKPTVWRRLGSSAYFLILLEWAPVALAIIVFQDFLLGMKLRLGILSWLGWAVMLMGVILHTWTGKLLGWKALIGYSELKPTMVRQELVTKGPFSVIRHPTYSAHTLMFVGIFFMTGFLATGLLAILDLVTSYFLIIPLEERELLSRFGEDYSNYKQSVPKFFPRILEHKER